MKSRRKSEVAASDEQGKAGSLYSWSCGVRCIDGRNVIAGSLVERGKQPWDAKGNAESSKQGRQVPMPMGLWRIAP